MPPKRYYRRRDGDGGVSYFQVFPTVRSCTYIFFLNPLPFTIGNKLFLFGVPHTCQCSCRVYTHTHTHTHPRNPRGSEKCTWKLLREEEKKRKKGKKKKEILFLLEGRRGRGGLLNWVTLWPPAYSSLLNQEIHWFTCVLFLPCVCVCERIPYYSPLPGIFLLFFFFFFLFLISSFREKENKSFNARH